MSTDSFSSRLPKLCLSPSPSPGHASVPQLPIPSRAEPYAAMVTARMSSSSSGQSTEEPADDGASRYLLREIIFPRGVLDRDLSMCGRLSVDIGRRVTFHQL